MSVISFQCFIQQSALTATLQQQDSIYLAPNIPHKKALGAQYYLPQSLRAEDILLLVDDTVFGSAKAGLSITRDGLYYRADFEEVCYYPFAYISQVQAEIGLLTHALQIHPQIKLSLTQLSSQAVCLLAEFLNAFVQSAAQQDHQHREEESDEGAMTHATACGLLVLVPQQFNEAQLKRAYRQQMADFHPDLYQQLPQAVQALIATHAQQLNQARDVLQDWLKQQS